MREGKFYQVVRAKEAKGYSVWDSGLIADCAVDSLPPLAGTCTLHVGRLDERTQITIANCEPQSWNNDEPGPVVVSGTWKEMYEAFLIYVRML